MRLDEAFPSKYLTASELDEGDLVVTIADCDFEEFTDPKTKKPDRKPVLRFRQKDIKPLILNKTNFKTISNVLGSDETEDWTGQRISLYATEVESFGEMTMAIRVRLKAPAASQQPQAQAARAGAASPKAALGARAAVEPPNEEEIPF